jgi:hypothetical protein
MFSFQARANSFTRVRSRINWALFKYTELYAVCSSLPRAERTQDEVLMLDSGSLGRLS